MTLLNVFSGIGGFSLAASWCGIETVAFCEIEPRACAVLNKNFPQVPIEPDVELMDGRKYCGVDIISGGFPCTDLSQSANGSHTGLDGRHSGLFFPLARVAVESNAEWIVFENVPQVVKYLDRIQEELPHYEFSHRIFESADFGSLSRRKRAYIVGHSRRECAEQVLDFAEEHGSAFRSRRPEDVLPMCLPWKGGVSLERLASCVVEDTQTDATRIRESNGLPGRMDGARYLMLGNSVTPIVPYWIFRGIQKTTSTL